MASPSTGAKKWAMKFDMSEKELMQNIIKNLLDILCSSIEYINQEDLNALRSARANYVNREENMDVLLAEISVVRDACMERMDRMKQAEKGLIKALKDIRRKMKYWPAFVKGSVNLVCDEKQKLLSSIANQRLRVHSKDEEDNACARILSLLEHEQRLLTKYFTYMKNDTEPNHVDYSTFAADPAVLNSIGADRPLHLHHENQIMHIKGKMNRFDAFWPEYPGAAKRPNECKKYLCPFQQQLHLHECKLPDCDLTHYYTCSNTKCAQPHYHTMYVEEPCRSEQCNKHPHALKFGDSICFQREPAEACK